MRVIAGSARRIQLQTPVGLDTRPTTDRIKETLFNMIQPQLWDCQFLDLFSGSGAIGIEALSRGAKNAVFVEQGAEAMHCIEKNLQATKLTEQSIDWRRDRMGLPDMVKMVGSTGVDSFYQEINPTLHTETSSRWTAELNVKDEMPDHPGKNRKNLKQIRKDAAES